ncbi:MAG: hypothetical protein D6693_06855 [Planctomycetota bacterium]|nr:MAG: hypothetical protein D6693_06855 [Planctomycetota bacterium]
MADPLRPTFEMVTPAPPIEAAARLERLFRDAGSPYEGRSVGTHLTITLRRDRRRFWSPWLDVELAPAGEAGESAAVRARFGPAPAVWTGFMLGYLALATAALFAGVWGAAQWSLGRAPTMLWGVAGCAVVAAAMLWSARAGQALAREQMRELRDAALAALDGRPVNPPGPGGYAPHR